MGARSVFSLLVSATLPVLAGNFLDGFYDRYLAFCIIYVVAWSFSLLESLSMGKITEPIPHEGKDKKIKFTELFSTPIKNKKFMKFLGIQMFFHLAWFMSMTFASLYEIKYMQVSYSTLTIMGSIGAVIQMFLYPIWGKVIDKHGSAIVMRIAMLLFMVHAGIYIFMVKANAPYLLLLLNINGSILSPAWGLSTFNERFSTIPKEGRTAYDSFFTTMLAIVILLAPTLGNLLRNAIIDSKIQFWVFPEFKLVFILSFALLMILNVALLIQSKKKNNLEAEKIFIGAVRLKLRRGFKRR
jgi:MFS family permease